MLVPLLVLIGSPPAGAQQAEQGEEVVGLEEIRVVGSRSAGRSAADSPVPVDVIDGDSLKHYGSTDMNDLLSATVPSYKVFQYGIGVEAALVRPAKLRGLPPDSTLVLVNGKRPSPLLCDYPLELWVGERFARDGYRLHPVHRPQTGGGPARRSRRAVWL